MKNFMSILLLFFNVIIFAQDRGAEFSEGNLQLKKIIQSKIILDSIDAYEDTIVKLIFTIGKNGKLKEINCKSDDIKTKTEFLRVASEIKKKWKSAIRNGKKIESKIAISFPIVFE